MLERPLLGAWTRAPAVLLPTPPALLGKQKQCAAKRPPKLDVGHSATEAAARKCKRRAAAGPKLPSWIDSCADDPARLGRCRVRLPDGRTAAKPFDLAQAEKEMADAAGELIVVEMRGPNGDDQCWLDDEAVDVVDVSGGASPGPLELCLLDRKQLRAWVHAKVPLSPFVRTLTRAVYTLCAPIPGSQFLVTLVPAKDVEGFRVSGRECAPP